MWNGEPFEPEEEVSTLLLVTGKGVVTRYDVHRRDLAEALPTLEGQELGRWTRTLKPKEDGAGEDPGHHLRSAEALFFAMFGEQLPMDGDAGASALDDLPEEPPPAGEDSGKPLDDAGEAARAALQHVLALHLERKRVLRARGQRRREGEQEYVHVKSGKSFAVPVLPLDERLFEQLTRVIGELVV